MNDGTAIPGCWECPRCGFRTAIPGCWECPRCGFRLHKRVIAMMAGDIYVDTRLVREECPNDGLLLLPAVESTPDAPPAKGEGGSRG